MISVLYTRRSIVVFGRRPTLGNFHEETFYNEREVACKVALTLTTDGDMGKKRLAEIETDPIEYLILSSHLTLWPVVAYNGHRNAPHDLRTIISA